MADEITDEELDLILARAEASLSAPWESFIEGRDHTGGDSFIRTGGGYPASPDLYLTLSYWDEPPRQARAEKYVQVQDFVAAAREDVPRLVAEIRRMRR